MGMYGQFFDSKKRGMPYLSQEEALGDIQAFVDMYLNMAFYNRDLDEEHLDMRGVVITPQEFRQALTNWTLNSRSGNEPEAAACRTAVQMECALGKNHIDSRVRGVLPRVHLLAQSLSLDWQERFCFYLALLSDRDRKYERIYGYIQDNVAARQPTLGLGIWLYRMGEPAVETGDMGEPAVETGDMRVPARETEAGTPSRQDSPLWIYLFRDTMPEEGESRLSRPMVLRENIYRYLNGEGWFDEWWSSFAWIKDGGNQGKKTMVISLSGLLDAYEHQDHRRKMEIREVVSTIDIASRVEGAVVSFTGLSGLQGRSMAVQLLRSIESTGLGPVEVNELGPCAVRVHCGYSWNQLILEEEQKELMRQICSCVQYRDQVERWGFGGRSGYGNGISAVFYGAPGTGKTMAAQVLGRELGMAVYKIDLSQLMSKYIGETEKNLNQLFERAGENSAILFFDEADGLFAKRSAVESSNDRYANMETGYLLQKFEEYDGIVILATNFIHNIDEAFKRRIRFFVRFTFPDRKIRLKLWKSILPEQARIDEPLLFDKYAAGFELSGSDIRSVLTNAAYHAASHDRGIRNEDIVKALKVHYLKMGRRLEEKDII